MNNFDPASPLDVEDKIAAIETAAHAGRLKPLRQWIKPRVAADGLGAASQGGHDTAGGGDIVPADVPGDLAGRLIARPISGKTLHVLRFMAESERPEFYLEDAVKAVPGAKSYMDLRGAWAGLTRRTRKILNDPDALLVHWREVYDAEGNWVDWVGAISNMTHVSLRKQFGLSPPADT